MRTSRHPGIVSKPEKNTKFWPNSVIRHGQAQGANCYNTYDNYVVESEVL